MIIESIMNLFKGTIKIVFSVLPNIPSLPNVLQKSLDKFFNMIFSNLSVLSLFIRIDTIKIVVPILVVILTFDKVYKFAMWVIKKIPLSIN